MTLKDFVDLKMTHADKTAEANGYPLIMENCKVNKKMNQLEVYGNSVQDGIPTPESPVEVQSVGELVTNEADVNFGKYKIPVVTRGKNLVKDAREVFRNFAGYTELEEDGRQCIRIKSNSGVYAIFDFTFKENTQYTISFDFKCNYDRSGVSLNHDVPFSVYYTDGNIDYCSLKPIDNTWYKYVLTTAKNKTISHIKGIGYEYRVYDYIDINTFQISEGTDGEYEPYVEPITTNIFLDEPLRKLGDYADYIDFKNKKVVRNTFVRVYDGYNKTDNPFNKSDNEENWGGSEVNTDVNENFWQYTLNDTLPILPKNGHHSADDYKQVPICLQVPVKTGSFDAVNSPKTIDKEMIWFCQQGRGVRLFLSKDRVGGTRSNLLTYLRSNPITVVIATYQPYEEPIVLDLPKLNTKTTIIEVDTSLAPSDAYGKYIKK